MPPLAVVVGGARAPLWPQAHAVHGPKDPPDVERREKATALAYFSRCTPSTLARSRSKVPSGRWPALRAISTTRQSEKPSGGRQRGSSASYGPSLCNSESRLPSFDKSCPASRLRNPLGCRLFCGRCTLSIGSRTICVAHALIWSADGPFRPRRRLSRQPPHARHRCRGRSRDSRRARRPDVHSPRAA